MKTIGLIGGMSWESSLEYYRIINEQAKIKLGGFHSAQCLMYSVDFAQIEALQHQNNWEELTKIMIGIAQSLKDGGVDFIVICTNTMHKMADDIERSAGIKVLHIAQATGKTIVQRGMKKVGLLGTKFTMEGDFYTKLLKDKFDVDVLIPDDKDRDFVHAAIYNELCKGEIKDASRVRFIEIIHSLAKRGAQGVILGCTEIPLLVKQSDTDVELFDTTTIHAVAALEYALAHD